MKNLKQNESIKQIVQDIKRLRWALFAIAIYLFATYLLFGSVCPVVLLSGFPCPGCGLTRGCLLLLCGQIKPALQYHPLAPLWMAFLLWGLLCRYVKKGNGETSRYMGRQFVKPMFCVLIVVTLLVYAVRMLVGFPSAEPLVYHKENLMYWMLNRSF